MSKGLASQQRVVEALEAFERAVTKRENKGVLGGKVSLQQEVDRAREQVLKVVAEIVTAERMAKEAP